MLELLLVRHGETDSNIQRKYLGWTDIDLNDNGLKHAHLAMEKLADKKIDKIYCSPLLRTRRTAEIINQKHALEINYCDALKERNFGIFDDLTYQEICDKYPEANAAWKNDWINYCIEGGESALESHQRVNTWVDEIIKNNHDGTFLLVTHLGCIRSMAAYLLGMKIEDIWRIWVDNGSITRFEFNEGYGILKLLNG